MEIKQKTYMNVEKDNKLLQVVIDPDMPLGLIFDALMELKGYVIERMAQSHKEEEAEADKQMGEEKKAEEKKE